ncbi:MAG: S8 family serine peptidase, partial [Actinobacteria bacterium]|nr:S8 family serine peptidase [Actinomycetota bacterium]
SRVSFTERRSFGTLWNGLSVRIDPSRLPELERLPGVKAIYPVLTVPVPPGGTGETPSQPQPQVTTALQQTGADIVQSQLGFTGTGVRVGVIDTGTDWNHPDLGGCFGPGCRVETGYDFVGDAYDANPASPTYSPLPVPDSNPDDCNGRGTHVSGIVGANGSVRGVAPSSTLGVYRVFGCEGSTETDIVLAAMERALADGMDVLTVSIDAPFQWPQYPTAQAGDRLVDEGVVVVAPVGDSGELGLYSAGAPGVGDRVIGVASVDNNRLGSLTFIVSPSGRRVSYLSYPGAPPPPTEGTTPEIVYVGRGCLGDEYLADPAGKVALIVASAPCIYNERYQRAASAGAVGVIFYGFEQPFFAGRSVVSRGIFAVDISSADGLHIRELLSGGARTGRSGGEGGTRVTVTWTTVRGTVPNLTTPGLISPFSSWGPTATLTLKPDISAPGGLIASTWPLEKGAITTLSGTSQASAHVAGAAALLLEARPDTRPREVRSILQNTTRTVEEAFGFASSGFSAPIARQGAGLLRIDRAILTKLSVRPGKLELGESEAGPAIRTLTITNHSDEERVYRIGASFTPSVSGTFMPVSSSGPGASPSISPRAVTLAPGASAQVTVTFTFSEPRLRDGSVYGGFISVASDPFGSFIGVPYMGYIGDYQSIRVLAPTPCGYPWLARRTGTPAECGSGFANQPGGATYTLVGDDIPVVLAHLDHQSRRLEADVFDADTGARVGRAFAEDYLPRNATATGFFEYAWDGTIVRGANRTPVPSGRYVLELTVFKALGILDNPAHQERWRSPVITVARPVAATTPAPQPPAAPSTQGQQQPVQQSPATPAAPQSIVTVPPARTVRTTIVTARLTTTKGVRSVSVRVNGAQGSVRLRIRLIGAKRNTLATVVRRVPTNRTVRVPSLRPGRLVKSVRVTLA